MSDCPHCKTLAEQNNQLAIDVAALQAETLQLVYQKRGLRAELDKLEREEPEAQRITRLLELWNETCKHSSKRTNLNLSGNNAKVVRKALKSLTAGEMDDREAYCAEAINGLSLVPYMGEFGKRFPVEGSGRQRKDDIWDALRDEKHIEALALYWQRATATTEDERREAWWACLCAADRRYELLAAEASWERYRAEGPRLYDRDIPAWMVEHVTGALRRLLGETSLPQGVDAMLAHTAILAVDAATYRQEVAKRPGALTAAQWNEKLLGPRNAAQQEPYDPDKEWAERRARLFAVPDPESEAA